MTETSQPKRRGRPPGSKNTPKSGLTVLKPGQPVPFEQAGYVRTTPIDIDATGRMSFAGQPTKVHLIWRRGLSQAPSRTVIDWPAEWRLPAAGEAIHLSKEFGGFVEYVDWWLEGDDRHLKVYLR